MYNTIYSYGLDAQEHCGQPLQDIYVQCTQT